MVLFVGDVVVLWWVGRSWVMFVVLFVGDVVVLWWVGLSWMMVVLWVVGWVGGRVGWVAGVGVVDCVS